MLPAFSDPFWMALAAKMGASAMVVVAASILVERVGSFLGAMIATLPISAGPAYIFLAMDHGSAFLEASARTSLPVFAATGAFVAAYVWLAQRHGTACSTGGALLVWLAAAILIRQASWEVGEAALLNAVVYGAVILVTRPHAAAAPAKGDVRRSWDIPFRAMVVMALVAGVVLAGRILGPEAAGITAVLPVVFTSLILVLQPRLGGERTAAIMVNGLLGLIGFMAALASLSLSAMALGSAASLSLALAICLSWNAVLIGLHRLARRVRPR